MLPQNKNNITRISNILNLTRQEFSVVEKRMMHFVLLELKENQGFNIDIDDKKTLLEIIISGAKLRETNKDVIKEAVEKITSRKIHFDKSNDSEDYFGAFVIFPYARYEAKKGVESQITIQIHPACKKLFLELSKGYTSIDVDAILNLSSQYAIRMYELMSMYLNQSSWTVNMIDLRTLLGLNYSKYKNYTDFERAILLYSQKELWEHCGIYFEWAVAQKERKKITALTFTIRSKEKQEKAQVNADVKATMDYIKLFTPKEIAEKSHILMTQYLLTDQQKDYILSDTSVFNEFIRVHAIIENMIERNNPPKNRTKYLAKSLGLDKVKFT